MTQQVGIQLAGIVRRIVPELRDAKEKAAQIQVMLERFVATTASMPDKPKQSGMEWIKPSKEQKAVFANMQRRLFGDNAELRELKEPEIKIHYRSERQADILAKLNAADACVKSLERDRDIVVKFIRKQRWTFPAFSQWCATGTIDANLTRELATLVERLEKLDIPPAPTPSVAWSKNRPPGDWEWIFAFLGHEGDGKAIERRVNKGELRKKPGGTAKSVAYAIDDLPHGYSDDLKPKKKRTK